MRPERVNPARAQTGESGVGCAAPSRRPAPRGEQGWTERAGGVEMSGVGRLSKDRTDASRGRKKIVLKKIYLFIQ